MNRRDVLLLSFSAACQLLILACPVAALHARQDWSTFTGPDGDFSVLLAGEGNLLDLLRDKAM